MIRVGDLAPDFELPIHTGGTFRLSDHRGKSIVVVYFYPQDFTMNCTKEACTFQNNYRAIQSYGVRLLGVSRDSVESHQRFVQEHHLTFPLASDTTLAVHKQYDALWLGGLRVKRATYVIDRTGIVQGRFVHEVLVDRHLEHVLSTLQRIQVVSHEGTV
ncbi:MAG TPA: peroxiredoxin [Bacteroidota bacterium]